MTFTICGRVCIVGGETTGRSRESRGRRCLTGHPGGVGLRCNRHITRCPGVLDCDRDRLSHHLRRCVVALDDATRVVATAVLPLGADDDSNGNQANWRDKL